MEKVFPPSFPSHEVFGGMPLPAEQHLACVSVQRLQGPDSKFQRKQALTFPRRLLRPSHILLLYYTGVRLCGASALASLDLRHAWSCGRVGRHNCSLVRNMFFSSRHFVTWASSCISHLELTHVGPDPCCHSTHRLGPL